MKVVVQQSLETPYEGDELTRAARQKIDYDISELKRKIQSLRTKRNGLAPISVLPPEVLSSIFVIVRDSCPYGTYITPQSSRHPVPWINVGHICRHWREIVLNCPHLWSIPVFTRPNLAQEMMRRSGMAPLTIRSTTSTLSMETLEQLESALAQTTRIRSIELSLDQDPQRSKGIFSILSQPTPLLEYLHLSCFPIPFPPDTLSNAPRLRSINLTGLEISWESAILKHTALTSLRLTNGLSGGSTMGQMMDTLHHLPNLRVLALKSSIPPYMTSDGNIRTVDFKFLERLEINAKGADCTYFLRHIQYPSSTIVRLHSFSISVEDGVTTISLLGQNLSRAQNIEAGIHRSPVVIRSVRLTSEFLDKIGIAFFNRTHSINKLDETDGQDPIVQINFDGRSFYAPAQGRFLTSVTDSFNLSSLEEALLDWNFTSTHIGAIQDSLGKLPNLKVINISRTLSQICLALAGTSKGERPKDNPTDDPPQSQGTSQHTSPVVLFPALETLRAQGMDLRQRQQQYPGIIDRLMDMLIQRSNDNMPIDNLSFEQCRGGRTWQIRLLGELVVHLKVDGEVVDVRELGSDGWSDEDEDSDEHEEDEDENSDDGGYFYHRGPRFLPCAFEF